MPPAAEQFWGCTNYPTTSCRGTREVEPEQLIARPPGSSAQAIFEEKKRRHRNTARAALPAVAAFSVLAITLVFHAVAAFVGPWAGAIAAFVAALGCLALVFRLPREALVWERGASGERKTGAALASLERNGFVSLHDRQLPGSRANIDHVAIGPQGVFVIETKYWSGNVDITHDKLFLNDSERGNVVDQVYREAIAVQIALGDRMNALRLTVTPVLCVHHAHMPWFDKQVAGIRVLRGSELRRLADGPATLAPQQVQELAALADALLRPMY